MNPCPCGYYPDRNKCRCTQPQIEKYLGKISGPILDRIDLCVELHPVDILHLQKTKTEKSSEDMKRQIRHARERQAERFAGTDCRFNGDIRSAQVEEYCPLGEEGQKVMEQLYRTLQLSARVYHRILKTARTIADLEDREEITGEHLLEAACYRPRRRIGINCVLEPGTLSVRQEKGAGTKIRKTCGLCENRERDRYVYGGGREKYAYFCAAPIHRRRAGRTAACTLRVTPGGI